MGRFRKHLVVGMAGAVVAAGLASCGSGTETPPPPGSTTPDVVARSPRPEAVVETGTLRVLSTNGPVTVRVEIADTPEARSRGLMGRARLAPDAGMVFLFDKPTTNRFWMKNTLIPLSIAFWDGTNRILAIRDMVPCREDPCPVYSAGAPYIGAVEVNRGFFRTHGVKVGDRVELEH
ncbi:MAG: DUF192 domain-containing protein [Actinomycetota bacterium]|nr:DUF192 domain-containing protein [Actinomycetota bacterium]